jgi:hypothetical protein
MRTGPSILRQSSVEGARLTRGNFFFLNYMKFYKNDDDCAISIINCGMCVVLGLIGEGMI